MINRTVAASVVLGTAGVFFGAAVADAARGVNALLYEFGNDVSALAFVLMGCGMFFGFAEQNAAENRRREQMRRIVRGGVGAERDRAA